MTFILILVDNGSISLQKNVVFAAFFLILVAWDMWFFVNGSFYFQHFLPKIAILIQGFFHFLVEFCFQIVYLLIYPALYAIFSRLVLKSQILPSLHDVPLWSLFIQVLYPLLHLLELVNFFCDGAKSFHFRIPLIFLAFKFRNGYFLDQFLSFCFDGGVQVGNSYFLNFSYFLYQFGKWTFYQFDLVGTFLSEAVSYVVVDDCGV